MLTSSVLGNVFRKAVPTTEDSDYGITSNCFRSTCNFNDCFFNDTCYHYGELGPGSSPGTWAAAAQEMCRTTFLPAGGQLLVIDTLEKQKFLASTLNYLSNYRLKLTVRLIIKYIARYNVPGKLGFPQLLTAGRKIRNQFYWSLGTGDQLKSSIPSWASVQKSNAAFGEDDDDGDELFYLVLSFQLLPSNSKSSSPEMINFGECNQLLFINFRLFELEVCPG